MSQVAFQVNMDRRHFGSGTFLNLIVVKGGKKSGREGESDILHIT